MSELEMPALERSLQRLSRSREALRATLLPAPRPAGSADGSFIPQRLSRWLRRGPLEPVMRSVEPWLDGMQRTLQRWWRRHPWRPSAEIANGTLRANVLPWMRRHPVVAVGLGAAAGVAFAVAAPWRSASLQQAARGSGRSLRRWALRQLTGPAAQTVLAGVVTSLLTARATRPEPAAPSPRPDEPAADAPPPV